MTAILQQYGLTSGKLVAIGVLSLVLLGVWGNALLGGKRATPSPTRQPPPVVATAPQPIQPTQPTQPTQPSHPISVSKSLSKGVRQPLQEANLAEVSGHDPFARPLWAIDKPVVRKAPVALLNQREALIAKLRAEGVTLVMLSGEQKIASFEGKLLRPGDTLSGFRVLDITEAGIVLSEQPVRDES